MILHMCALPQPCISNEHILGVRIQSNILCHFIYYIIVNFMKQKTMIICFIKNEKLQLMRAQWIINDIIILHLLTNMIISRRFGIINKRICCGVDYSGSKVILWLNQWKAIDGSITGGIVTMCDITSIYFLTRRLLSKRSRLLDYLWSGDIRDISIFNPLNLQQQAYYHRQRHMN